MKSASYVGEKKFSTRVYDKRNEFSLPIVKFPSFLFFFFFFVVTFHSPITWCLHLQLVRLARIYNNFDDCYLVIK